jgi:Major Facilitator Superfamily
MLSAAWYRIIGLSALQGAISLTWLVYNIYLPKILIGYGFSPTLAVTLLIVENAIAVVLEPLFGSLSDRAFRWVATKFGWISIGVIVTAALTVLIPTVFVFKDLFSAVTWILPGVLIAWAMAMAVFRAPAISLIGRYASVSDLPIAMSFLTLVGGLIGAIKPISQDFLLSLGAPVAFTIASIVLLAATALLRYVDPPATIVAKENRPIVPLNMGLLIALGWGIAWSSRSLFETLPKILKVNLPQVNTVTVMVMISLAISLSALSSGKLAAKYGNAKAMLLGIMATLIALLLMVFLPTIITIGMAILLIICCFSMITNGAIPLAINLFPAHRSGLAVGLYFAGFNAGASSFSALFNPVSSFTPSLGATCGLISLAVAGGCIWGSHRSQAA